MSVTEQKLCGPGREECSRWVVVIHLRAPLGCTYCEHMKNIRVFLKKFSHNKWLEEFYIFYNLFRLCPLRFDQKLDRHYGKWWFFHTVHREGGHFLAYVFVCNRNLSQPSYFTPVFSVSTRNMPYYYQGYSKVSTVILLSALLFQANNDFSQTWKGVV